MGYGQFARRTSPGHAARASTATVGRRKIDETTRSGPRQHLQGFSREMKTVTTSSQTYLGSTHHRMSTTPPPMAPSYGIGTMTSIAGRLRSCGIRNCARRCTLTVVVAFVGTIEVAGCWARAGILQKRNGNIARSKLATTYHLYQSLSYRAGRQLLRTEMSGVQNQASICRTQTAVASVPGGIRK